MKTNHQGRIALVTGGTRGIGAAICKRLADSGARVATNYRNEEAAQKWLSETKAQGYEFKAYRVDVSDFEGCGKMVAQIEKELGPISILVNNAGITWDVTLRKMTKEQWDTVLRINLDSVFNVTRQMIQGMMDRGFGRIINLSSINGQKGQIGQSNYTASKAGMHGFTMSVAQEVARKGKLGGFGVSRGNESAFTALGRKSILKQDGFAGVSFLFAGIGDRIVFLQTFPGDPRHAGRGLADLRKHFGRAGIGPIETQAATHFLNDPEILAGIARRVNRLPSELHAPVGVGEGPGLFRKGRGGEHHVRETRGFGEEDILDHQVVELGERAAGMVQIRIGHRRVLAHDMISTTVKPGFGSSVVPHNCSNLARTPGSATG